MFLTSIIPRAFDHNLSRVGKTLPIAKRDVPGAGKFEPAARI
jgi:hypothetical protein